MPTIIPTTNAQQLIYFKFISLFADLNLPNFIIAPAPKELVSGLFNETNAIPIDILFS